uniref:Uncharacterized protein n=1 Tax=Solanum lycopersicum TaxID=4081 RepID=A0A3Q7G502_SOLLC
MENSNMEAYSPNLTALWYRCNVIVLSCIMNYVSKELLGGIVYSTNAIVMWWDLKDIYDKVDGSRIFQLINEIASSSQVKDQCQSHKSGCQTEITALVSIRARSNPENRLKKPFSPYGYDPNGFTKAICFRLVGYPQNFERRRSENLNNQQSNKKGLPG